MSGKSRKKGHLNHVTRRQAIALMGGGGVAALMGSPVQLLLRGIADGIIQKAEADVLGTKPRNFVYLAMNGGAARWVFEPIVPYGDPNGYKPNPMVKTRVDSSGNPIYSSVPLTVAGETINMPYLWGCRIPTSDGGTVPMANLLPSYMCIRGINLLADGHDQNANKQLHPLSGSPSLDGMVADGSTAPIPAVSSGGPGGSAFKSAKGLAQSGGDLNAILAPFNRSGDGLQANYLSRRDALDAAFNKVFAMLGSYSRSGFPGSDALYPMHSRAQALVKAGVGNVNAEFGALYGKYHSLMARIAAAHDPRVSPAEPALVIRGITDTPIPLANVPLGTAYAGAPNVPLGASISSGYISNPDLRTIMTSNVEVRQMVEGFAIAEYLLVRGYSSSINIGCGGTYGHQIDSAKSVVDNSVVDPGNVSSIPLDEHYTGSHTSLIRNSFMWRVTAAFLYELISVLKANNLYNETVIQIGGDFGRNPSNQGRGSDHGWMTNSASIFSGAIDKPYIFGNSLLDGQNQWGCGGTWNAAGPLKIDNTIQTAVVGHQTSSLAELLRVQRLFQNNSSFFLATSKGIVPLVDKAKNV